MENNNNQGIFSLEVDEYGKAIFLEMARWTKFLAILGYIFLGLLMLVGIGAILIVGVGGPLSDNPVMSSNGYSILLDAGIFIVTLMIAGVCFYPISVLNRHSGSMKIAINANNKEHFNTSIIYLKNAFKYVGILMIIVLCFYVVVIMLAIASVMKQ